MVQYWDKLSLTGIRQNGRKVDLCIRTIYIGVQKINISRLKTYGIVIALFKVYVKDEKSCIFKKTFLLANIGMDVNNGKFFLT